MKALSLAVLVVTALVAVEAYLPVVLWHGMGTFILYFASLIF